jgi:hypothetical protein
VCRSLKPLVAPSPGESVNMAPVVELVNNAGIYPWQSFEDTDYETWRIVIGVNLDGGVESLMSKRPSELCDARSRPPVVWTLPV